MEIIEATIISILLKKPFYGHFIQPMQIQYIGGYNVASVMITDKIVLSIQPDIFKEMTLLERESVILHEADHILSGHLDRVGDRDIEKFNIACDIAINQHIPHLPDKKRYTEILNKVFPENQLSITGALMPEMFNLPRDKTAEEYYQMLPHSNRGMSLDSHDWKNIHSELSKVVIKKTIQHAINESQGNIPRRVERLIENYFETKTDWKVLTRYILRASNHKIVRTRKKPNRRYGNIYPGHKTSYDINIVLGLDQSSSMTDEDIALCVNQINKIYSVSPKIHIYSFDVEAHYLGEYKKRMIIKRERDGGTDYREIIRLSKEKKADLLIITTDGEADLDIKKPNIPVVWAITEENFERFEAPFGIKIKLK